MQYGVVAHHDDGGPGAPMALDAAEMGVWDWDLHDDVVRCDARMARLHGLDPATFDGRMESFLERVHPEDRLALEAAIGRAMSTVGPFSEEFRVLQADDSVIWVVGRGGAVTDEAGEAVRIIGVGFDSTDLGNARERAVRTLGYVSDGLVVLDADWCFRFVNPAAGRLLHRRPGDLLGMNLWKEFPETVGTELWDRCHEAMRSQWEVTFESHFGPRQGWFEVRLFPGPDGLTAYFRSVEERRAAEAQREALVARLRKSLSRHRAVADALQRAVLPEVLPLVTGWHLAARYLPATAGVSVGGDFYDAYRVGERLVLTVGDVAGHGLRAAAVMGQVRNSLRGFTLDHLDPDEVVVRARRLLRTQEPDALVTMLFGVLDPATGEVEWISAGHPPPIVVCAGGSARFLADAPCPPLGAPRPWAERRAAHHSVIGPGETHLWYTDGLIERRGEDLQTGLERLLAVAPLVDPSAPATLDAVLAELVPPAGWEDDVCLLALRRV